MRKSFAQLVTTLALLGLVPGCQAPTPALDADAVGRYLARTGQATAPETRLALRFSLEIVRGAGLPDLDAGPGEGDPYVIASVAGARLRSSIADGTSDPVWGDSFIFEAPPESPLELKVLDADGWSDEHVATTTVALPALAEGETRELDLPLRNGDAGVLVLRVRGLARPGQPAPQGPAPSPRPTATP
jgi:hypothetical protein